MTDTIATLGLRIDSSQAAAGAANLDKLAAAANKAAPAVTALEKAASGVSATMPQAAKATTDAAKAGEPLTIERRVVEGSRDLGCARRTIIDGKQVVQLYFAENDAGFGKMVSRRTTTRRGITTDELFDPPVPLDELPELRDATPSPSRQKRDKTKSPTE